MVHTECSTLTAGEEHTSHIHPQATTGNSEYAEIQRREKMLLLPRFHHFKMPSCHAHLQDCIWPFEELRHERLLLISTFPRCWMTSPTLMPLHWKNNVEKYPFEMQGKKEEQH